MPLLVRYRYLTVIPYIPVTIRHITNVLVYIDGRRLGCYRTHLVFPIVPSVFRSGGGGSSSSTFLRANEWVTRAVGNSFAQEWTKMREDEKWRLFRHHRSTSTAPCSSRQIEVAIFFLCCYRKKKRKKCTFSRYSHHLKQRENWVAGEQGYFMCKNVHIKGWVTKKSRVINPCSLSALCSVSLRGVAAVCNFVIRPVEFPACKLGEFQS